MTDQITARSQPDPGQPSPWLTAREAARRAKCGRRVIYRAVAAGQLKAAKLTTAREIRVHQDWVDAWLESRITVINPKAPGRVPAPVAAGQLRRRRTG